jgi:hypothetical protein
MIREDYYGLALGDYSLALFIREASGLSLQCIGCSTSGQAIITMSA